MFLTPMVETYYSISLSGIFCNGTRT